MQKPNELFTLKIILKNKRITSQSEPKKPCNCLNYLIFERDLVIFGF